MATWKADTNKRNRRGGGPGTSEAFRQVMFALNSFMSEGQLPASLPVELKESPEFNNFIRRFEDYKQFILALGNGDLSLELKGNDRMAAALRSLQAHLLHLTQQVKLAAEGDLSQRVGFMGDLATSINTLVENVSQTQAALEQRSNELAEQHRAALNSTWDARIAQEEMENLYTQVERHLSDFRALQAKLKEQAIRDPLTGLYNRRYLEETLDREFSRANREQYPVCIVMLDIDHFKHFNDTYGHLAGDAVLRFLSKKIQGHTRYNDIVCRYGGEEMVIIAPKIDKPTAERRINELREMVESTPFDHDNQVLNITFSAGISVFPDDGLTGEDLIRTADFAMYSAKVQGRNRVVCYPE